MNQFDLKYDVNEVKPNVPLNKAALELIAGYISPEFGNVVKRYFYHEDNLQKNEQIKLLQQMVNGLTSKLEDEKRNSELRHKEDIFWRNVGLVIGVVGLFAGVLPLFFR